MEIADLTGECGTLVVPGFTTRIYAVCGCDIDTFPDRKTTTAAGDSITLDGNIVLKTGKKWASIDVISESGKLTEKEIGSIGSQNIQSQFDFKLLKTKAADEFIAKTPNGCMVFIIEDKDGNKRVIGSPSIPATRTNAEGVNGPNTTDEKVWNLSVMDNSGKVAPYYEGTIDLTA